MTRIAYHASRRWLGAGGLGHAAWKYGNWRNERQANEFRAALRVIAHPALQLSKRGSFGYFAPKMFHPENNSLYFNYLRAHFGQFAQKRARLATNAILELFARSRRTRFENGPARGTALPGARIAGRPSAQRRHQRAARRGIQRIGRDPHLRETNRKLASPKRRREFFEEAGGNRRATA